MMDAYSYQPCPSLDNIKKEFLTIMTEKYNHKDVKFIEIIVNDCIENYDKEKNLTKHSYTGYIMFCRKELMKIIDDSILLSEEDI